MNTQKPSTPRYESTDLHVHSVFVTIQGEGPFVGQPAIFIRLAGCNIQCPHCDTQYSESGVYTTPALVLSIRNVNPAIKLVVITGGEPLRQDISALIDSLWENGYTVQIETNGTLSPELVNYSKCYIVCSPKVAIHRDLHKRISAYKYVLHADQINPDDGLPTSALGNKLPPGRPPEWFKGPVYVQPIDVQNPLENARHLQAAIDSCLKYGYTLCLQIHKIINME